MNNSLDINAAKNPLLGGRGAGFISVIGAGTMGNGIAHVFAQSGFKVTLIDVSQEQLDKAIVTIGKNLDRQIAKGNLTEDARQSARVYPLLSRSAHRGRRQGKRSLLLHYSSSLC